MKTSTSRIFFAATLAIGIAGCGGGGGGGDDSPQTSDPAAQGLWVGSTADGRAITGLLFSDGTFYGVYSYVGNPDLISGVVQGSGIASNGSFTSSNTVDFNVEYRTVWQSTISASYTPRVSFNGTTTHAGGGSSTFTTTYDSDYETTPDLSVLDGDYIGQVATPGGATTATVTINGGGAIFGYDATDCSFSGSASPRTDGNAYNFSVTFGSSVSCLYPDQTLNGVAYYDSATARLVAAAPNASRTGGVLFAGQKLPL